MFKLGEAAQPAASTASFLQVANSQDHGRA